MTDTDYDGMAVGGYPSGYVNRGGVDPSDFELEFM